MKKNGNFEISCPCDPCDPWVSSLFKLDDQCLLVKFLIEARLEAIQDVHRRPDDRLGQFWVNQIVAHYLFLIRGIRVIRGLFLAAMRYSVQTICMARQQTALQFSLSD